MIKQAGYVEWVVQLRDLDVEIPQDLSNYMTTVIWNKMAPDCCRYILAGIQMAKLGQNSSHDDICQAVCVEFDEHW